jgi:hypothetical protein
MADCIFDFSSLPRPRGSYAKTLAAYNRGLLSIGFMCELAKYDEVFAAFIRKNGVEKP